MEILDFTYWNKLNEEASQISKIIRIPDRHIGPELEQAYRQAINKVLEETAEDVEYDVTSKDAYGGLEYTIHFKKEDDDVFSSMFGSPEVFTITLKPSFDAYGGGIITLGSLLSTIKRTFYSSVIDVEDNINVIRIKTTPELLEKGLAAIANNFVRGHDWRQVIPEKPTFNDYTNAFLKAKDNPKYIATLKDKISNLTIYYTVLDFLKNNMEDYVINKEELSTSISSELNKIKQLDFIKDKESSLKEALLFQKKLLKMANYRKEESPLVTDALVEVFRLLLDQYGDIKKVNIELSKV